MWISHKRPPLDLTNVNMTPRRYSIEHSRVTEFEDERRLLLIKLLPALYIHITIYSVKNYFHLSYEIFTSNTTNSRRSRDHQLVVFLSK